MVTACATFGRSAKLSRAVAGGSGVRGETIHNLGVNHTIKNGFGVISIYVLNKGY